MITMVAASRITALKNRNLAVFVAGSIGHQSNSREGALALHRPAADLDPRAYHHDRQRGAPQHLKDGHWKIIGMDWDTARGRRSRCHSSMRLSCEFSV
jgi:hypothetical protein